MGTLSTGYGSLRAFARACRRSEYYVARELLQAGEYIVLPDGWIAAKGWESV